jgi:DNA end-binding protein Ku
MRPIWKGSISFGLVNIPIALVSATKREELKFRLLRQSDLSPINYKRVAEVDGREVSWKEIVKGYEYEKGKFVVLKDEDFRRADVEATETIDILDFVPLREINPLLFTKPYYLEPMKGGARAYALLRDALRDSDKAGITKVVIKTRQHLAALRPQDDLLVLDLMHFPDELVDPDAIEIPRSAGKPGKRELTMARALIDEMTQSWDPARYTDDYTSSLLQLIEQKARGGGKELPGREKAARPSGDVIDLVAVLEESLAETGGRGRKGGKSRRKRASSASSTKRKRPRKQAA